MKNPQKTLTIEKAWRREINRRWSAFKKSTTDMLREMNQFAIESDIQNRDAIPFAMNSAQQRAYMVFLQSEIDRLLLETTQAPNWQAQYQLQSYERGIEMTRASLISQGASLEPTPAEVAQAATITTFTAIPSMGAASTSIPIHRDALEFLYNRSYESLKGWTDAMAKETRQILFNGAQQGKGIREITKQIVDRQNVSRSRARVIAQTEISQAFQQSATNETERAAEELDIEIKMRWLTVMDFKVRHLHAKWHGTTATPAENRVRIGMSPYNCRCGNSPVIPIADTKAKQDRFDKEREKMLSIERK